MQELNWFTQLVWSIVAYVCVVVIDAFGIVLGGVRAWRIHQHQPEDFLVNETVLFNITLGIAQTALILAISMLYVVVWPALDGKAWYAYVAVIVLLQFAHIVISGVVMLVVEKSCYGDLNARHAWGYDLYEEGARHEISRAFNQRIQHYVYNPLLIAETWTLAIRDKC